MGGFSTAVLVILLLIVLFWFIPLFVILFSRKTSGSEKLGWILAMLFISWLAFIFYLLFAPLKKQY
jgi:hypothetical protein